MPDDSFFWRIPRDVVLTRSGLQMFQIALRHDGEEFSKAKEAIDDEYRIAVGRDESQRHGGKFNTAVRAFEEVGWIFVDRVGGQEILRVTEAGRQAEQLLLKTPTLLRAAPKFLVDLLGRYQLNNPSGPAQTRNEEVRDEIRKSDVFPYWTLWRIMRSCDNRLTSDEIRRFVYRLQRSEDLDRTIESIREFRADVKAGHSTEELNAKYPPPLAGANAETKYLMDRAGAEGDRPAALILKPDPTTFELNPAFLDLVDAVLQDQPRFRDYIDPETWFRDYARPVPIDSPALKKELVQTAIPDDDDVWLRVKEIVDAKGRNILFIGPPGTSKTTYALAAALKLVDGDPARFNNLQFHPSFAYEDFIEGYVPSDEGGSPSPFKRVSKVFRNVCERAGDDPERLHVLVIDEINRGDTSRIMGEAMTYIERRGETFQLSSGDEMRVPANLVILATMNPFDKSISDLDQAMDRRFDKVDMPPSIRILRTILKGNDVAPELMARVVEFFAFLTREVQNRVGHAYFKDARDEASILRIWRTRLLPLLRDECRHDPERANRIRAEFERIFPISPPSSA